MRKYSPSISLDTTVVWSNSNTTWLSVKNRDTSFSVSPERILLTSLKVFPGTTTLRSEYSLLRGIFRIAIRCPSRETTFRQLFLISKSSPVISLLFSLTAIEKMVCLIISFSVYWEIVSGSSFSIIGKYAKSSPDLPGILNFAFSQVIVAVYFSSVLMVMSLSGSRRMIS